MVQDTALHRAAPGRDHDNESLSYLRAGAGGRHWPRNAGWLRAIFAGVSRQLGLAEQQELHQLPSIVLLGRLPDAEESHAGTACGVPRERPPLLQSDLLRPRLMR